MSGRLSKAQPEAPICPNLPPGKMEAQQLCAHTEPKMHLLVHKSGLAADSGLAGSRLLVGRVFRWLDAKLSSGIRTESCW